MRERTPAVDFDDRQKLPVFGLESRVTADVDELELEVELCLGFAEHLERTLAEVTTLRVVERHVGYG